MLLYCINDRVISYHDDAQTVSPSLYGTGVQVIPVPNDTKLISIGKQGLPYKIPTPTIPLLHGYAAYKRWLVTAKGVAVNGVSLATDDNSQTKISQIKQAFDIGTVTSITFKTSNGFMTVDAAQVTIFYNAVVAHVQSCFAAEAAAVQAINNNTASNYTQVDMFFAKVT